MRNAPKAADFPALDVEQVEQLLGRGDVGCYVKYRAGDVQSPDPRFSPLCISFKQDDGSVGHNVIYLNAAKDGAWGLYEGWVIISPEPWTHEDPNNLISTNQMWPSIDDMADVIPELITPLDPFTAMAGSVAGSSGGGNSPERAVGARDQQAARQAVTQGVRDAPSVSANAPLVPLGQWQGMRDDKPLYDIMISNKYALPTAIAATASRYGSELPGLARVLMSHGHIKGWTEELLDREMESGSPLGLLQAESSTMLLWMVVTEVSGCPFLSRALGPTVGMICRQRLWLEMDPSKIEARNLPNNASQLAQVVQALVEALNKSVEHFPLCCSQILYAIEQAVSSTFGLVATSTVSRYLFHRFILEAILAPAAVGITDAHPDEKALRSLALVHQIMEKLCTQDEKFSRGDAQERHLIPLNHILDGCRQRLDAFTQTVVTMGAPYSPVQPSAAENGGVVFIQQDLEALIAYLKERFVEVYSSIADLRSEAVAAEITQRLRPVLFMGSTKGQALPIGVVPHKPHPIGLTNAAYETRVPPPMGTEPPAVTAASQLRQNALRPPKEATRESLGFGINSPGTGELDTSERTGVGIIFRKDAYGLFHVLTLTKGGPAQRSNVIEVGDVIMEINGLQVVGMSLAQLKKIIMGPLGTPLRMVFERPRGPSSERYEVCLFRGNIKPNTGTELMHPTHAKSEGEDMRVFREMSKLVSEVDELQQRRIRAEKALHAAEALRQEYDMAANESEERSQRLNDELTQIRSRINKVRAKREQAEGVISDLKSQYPRSSRQVPGFFGSNSNGKSRKKDKKRESLSFVET
mmetsp:Transcript_7440/g.18578  ORF Transcript_7440/g.18578 Transcript_7440/m.18578 type:complete len:810 (-) Transcript_7440:35-2464(-)